jgi:hypothetical protein
MKHPNDMVQMDILGPFYIQQSSGRNYIISCIDDCSRKVTSKYSERKRSIDVLDVLEEWNMVNGKPKKILHHNGKVCQLELSAGSSPLVVDVLTELLLEPTILLEYTLFLLESVSVLNGLLAFMTLL